MVAFHSNKALYFGGTLVGNNIIHLVVYCLQVLAGQVQFLLVWQFHLPKFLRHLPLVHIAAFTAAKSKKGFALYRINIASLQHKQVPANAPHLAAAPILQGISAQQGYIIVAAFQE